MSAEATQAAAAAPERASAEAWWVRPAIPLLAAAAAFTWFLGGQLQRMYGMTGEADLARYQQAVWSVTQGRLPGATIALEPILLPIAGIERLWPSPIVLAIVSSAGLAAAGPAAFLLLRAILPAERRESVWLAVALAAPVPFWAATQVAARDLFQPEDPALAFALVAAWAGLRGRRTWMWAFVVLDLACGAGQAYSILVLALVMRSYGAAEMKRRWRLLMYLAVTWFVLGLAVVRPTLPGSVMPEAALLLAGAVASMFALPLLAPRWVLLAVPPSLLVLASDRYVLLLMFPLIVAGAIGARSLLRRVSPHPAIAAGIVLAAILIGWGSGPLPPSLRASNSLYGRPNAVAQLQTASSVIPAGAPVDADVGLEVWLANRPTIGDFPSMVDTSSYVVIDLNETTAEGLAASGRRVLYDDGRFQVWSPVGDY